MPLHVTVTVAGSELTVDTTGSAPEQRAPVNSPWAYTQAVSRMVLKTLATPNLPSNSGEHRVLRLIAPAGSIFNSGATAASWASLGTAMHLAEMILHALALAPARDDIPAMSGDDQPRVGALLPYVRTGRLGFSTFVLGPGFGAKRGADGPSALFMRQSSDLRSVPLEVLETRDPTDRHRYALDEDSGGPGQWRGASGHRGAGVPRRGERDHVGRQDERASAVLGLAGGQPPRRLSGVRFYVGTDQELGPPRCKQSSPPIRPGDRYIAWSAGGAGYGDPLDRGRLGRQE